MNINLLKSRKLRNLTLFTLVGLLLCSIALPSLPVRAEGTEEVCYVDRKQDKYMVEITHENIGYQNGAESEEKYTMGYGDYYYVFYQHLATQEDEPLFCAMPLTKIDKSLSDKYVRTDPLTIFTKGYNSLPGGAAIANEQVRRITFFLYGSTPNNMRNKENDYVATQIIIWRALGFNVINPANPNQYDLSWVKPYEQSLELAEAAWQGNASFHQGSFFIEPGTSLSIEDTNGLVQYFMKGAGYEPGISYDIGDQPGNLSMSWDYPNTLQFTAGPEFQGEKTVNLSMTCSSNYYGLNHERNQAVISAERWLEHPDINFVIKSTAASPIAHLEVQKCGEKIVDWELVDSYGEEAVYGPVFAEQGLEGISFELISEESIIHEAVTYPAGSLRYSATTDAEGKARFIDIPTGQYRLVETNTPAEYLPLSEDYHVCVEASDNPEDFQVIEIKNERRGLGLKAQKILADCGDLSDEQIAATVGKIRFALRNVESYHTDNSTLPAGSLLALSGLKPIPVKGGENGNSESQDIAYSLYFNLPYLGEFDLVELESGDYHKNAGSLRCDLADLSMATIDGQRAEFELDEPVINQRIEEEPEKEFDPGEEPSEESAEQPPVNPIKVVVAAPQPPTAPTQVEKGNNSLFVNGGKQETHIPVEVKIENPATHAATSPRIDVGSYTEKSGWDNRERAVLLPSTGVDKSRTQRAILACGLAIAILVRLHKH